MLHNGAQPHSQEGDSYELGMQVLKRNVLQQTQTGMRPRSQRLRSSRAIQFSAKRKAKGPKEKQIKITGSYRQMQTKK